MFIGEKVHFIWTTRMEYFKGNRIASRVAIPLAGTFAL